jgi:hypothetical protein
MILCGVRRCVRRTALHAQDHPGSARLPATRPATVSPYRASMVRRGRRFCYICVIRCVSSGLPSFSTKLFMFAEASIRFRRQRDIPWKSGLENVDGRADREGNGSLSGVFDEKEGRGGGP